MKPGTRTGVGRAPYSCGLVEPATDLIKYVLIVASANCGSISANSFAASTHACRAAEVERNLSNLVAHYG
jgi:hypothetical protein